MANPIHFPQKAMLPNPDVPWELSGPVFNSLKDIGGQKHKKYELSPSDQEATFISRYFNESPPSNRVIKRITCVHHPEKLRTFEAALMGAEDEVATNPAYKPKEWTNLADAAHRAVIYKKWEDKADSYSPVIIRSHERTQQCSQVKVFPLWHGTKAHLCDYICETGFGIFGSQSLSTASSSRKTDEGFFGSGIYFSNSAGYAADVYSKASDGGNFLFLAWVAMRDPFPVVAHKKCHGFELPRDMQELKGKGAYDNYDAHYIPVILKPGDTTGTIYYPCFPPVDLQPTDKSPWDEFVVFNKHQALAAFLIELDVSLTMQLSVTGQTLRINTLANCLRLLTRGIAQPGFFEERFVCILDDIPNTNALAIANTGKGRITTKSAVPSKRAKLL